MLLNIQKLYNKIGASHGEIGRFRDFYVDNQNGVIRYVVVDTGSWLPGCLMLISQMGLGALLLTAVPAGESNQGADFR